MESFYGGQPGQHFKISKIFQSKVAMTADLSMRWQSSIGVGEYVFIAYGIPNDTGSPSYLANRNRDLAEYNETYNSTLWQKVYREQNVITNEYDELTGIEVYYIDGDYGFGYKLLASLTGNTPQIQVGEQYIELEKPETYGYFEIDSLADIDKPTWIYHSPQMPEWVVNIDNSAHPESPITLVPTKDWDAAGYDPATDTPNFNFNFAIPKSAVSTVQLTPVDPAAPAELTLNKLWNTTDPNSSEQRFEFKLPRAAKFFYGTLLALHNPQAEQQTVPVGQLPPGIAKGDYYINSEHGFVYLCTNKTDSVGSFLYQAKFVHEPPDVTIDGDDLSTYTYSDGAWHITPPQVSSHYTDDSTETGYTIDFKIPQIPNFIADGEIIGPEETASISGNIIPVTPGAGVTTSSDYQFTFRIPRGPLLLSGSTNPGVISNTENGDYYFNTTTGDVFKLDNNTWTVTANIVGPVGPPLTFYDTTVSGTSANFPSTTDVTSVLNTYFNTHTPPALGTVVSVEWTYGANLDQIVYFWGSYVGTNAWAITQVTGSLNSFLSTSYSTDTTKAYNAPYVNSLIVNTGSPTNPTLQTYSANQIEALISWGSF